MAHHLEGITRLFDSGAPPVLSYMAVAGAALETAARAHWLLEAGIGARSRVARSWNEELYSLSQQWWLPFEVCPAHVADARNRIRSDAGKLGLTWHSESRGRPPWVASAELSNDERGPHPDQRPSIQAVMTELLGDRSLGRISLELLSAVLHASPYGLAQGLGYVDDQPLSSASARGRAVPRVQSRQTLTVLGVVMFACFVANDRALELCGWATKEWRDEYWKAGRLFAGTFEPENEVQAQDMLRLLREPALEKKRGQLGRAMTRHALTLRQSPNTKHGRRHSRSKMLGPIDYEANELLDQLQPLGRESRGTSIRAQQVVSLGVTARRAIASCPWLTTRIPSEATMMSSPTSPRVRSSGRPS